MSEIGKIKKFLKAEPLKTVKNPDSLSSEEIFQLFLPDILPENEKDLLTMFFVYKYKGKRIERKDDERLSDLIKADYIMDGTLLSETISTLTHINRYKKRGGEKLTAEQFRQTIFNMINDYSVKLDEKDLKILNAITQDMFITLREVSSQTSISYRTVQHHKKKLEERCLLEVTSRLDYSKIGLTNLVIMVEGDANVECPYLLSRHELWGGAPHTVFSIAVPPRAIKDIQKVFAKHFTRIWMWNIERFLANNSFVFYDTSKYDWNINWSSWSLYLSDVLSKGWNTIIPQELAPFLTEETSHGDMPPLTEFDLRFIETLLYKLDTPLEELSHKFNSSVGGVARTKKNFLDSEILVPLLRIENIGLNESILLIVESDLNILKSFVIAIKELPRAWIYLMHSLEHNPQPFLACWLEVPTGGFTPFERSVRQTLRSLAKYKLFFRSKHEGSTILTLHKLYNPETQTYEWNPEMLKINLRE
ncbi:MAG: winged helix-turn-helix transcriptional regulator [Candidatus Lokiarchaeia archaeon]